MRIKPFLLNLPGQCTHQIFVKPYWKCRRHFYAIGKSLSAQNLWQVLRVSDHPSEEDWNLYQSFCQHCHVPSSSSSTTHDYWSFQQRTSFASISAELWWMSSLPWGWSWGRCDQDAYSTFVTFGVSLMQGDLMFSCSLVQFWWFIWGLIELIVWIAWGLCMVNILHCVKCWPMV